MAHDRKASGAEQHHDPAFAAQSAGAQSGREHLAVHARQLALKSRLQVLQGDPRPVLPGLEQARRATMDHNVDRQAGMGSSVLINCAWYKR